MDGWMDKCMLYAVGKGGVQRIQGVCDKQYTTLTVVLTLFLAVYCMWYNDPYWLWLWYWLLLVLTSTTSTTSTLLLLVLLLVLVLALLLLLLLLYLYYSTKSTKY